MAKFFTLTPGHELRGLKIRLYPTREQETKLIALEGDMRHAWNWLVKQVEDVIHARQAYAVKNGLVGPRPIHPDYDGLEPEQAKIVKEAHRKACQDWHHQVKLKTDKLPQCAYRSLKEMLAHFGCKYDYQLMSRVVRWPYEEGSDLSQIPGSTSLQALVRNYFSKGPNQRRKKFRKRSDSMPLQMKSGDCFRLGDFGTRRGQPFYDCQVSFNGLKIRGRLPGKSPEGRVLEGVSIQKEPDGWWASIKQEAPIQVQPAPIPGTVIGIDVGLDYIAAMAAPKDNPLPPEIVFKPQIPNTREKSFSKKIAALQAKEQPVGRLQQKAAKHMKHTIYNEIVKPLRLVETIKIERLVGTIGQMGGSTKVSVMRSIASILTERYGPSRVREVEPHYTSQECSQCGHRSKESWSYDQGRVGQCPRCMFTEDRDLNAARNIAAKPPILLAA